ncbi:MAG: OsmC family protein [Chloroflexi bacterium]|nr:OsmC family protein [Chloroflexota bacterium]
MTIKHNVNLGALESTTTRVQREPSQGRRINRVEGTWDLQEGRPQFAAEISFEGGKTTLESDQPTFMGGGGTRPGPMLYALFGLASCFTASFTSVAAMEGIELEEIKTAAEFDLNFAKVLGVADLPIVEEVRVALTVRSPAPREHIERALRLAEERCPVVFCLSNPIRLVTTLNTT